MNAVWITGGTAKPFYARKKITVVDDILSAKAEVCGLGQFNFYINGEKVSDHILDPGWTDYNKIIQYVEFDVSDYLREDENILAAEVGNGWYNKQDEGYTFHFPEFMPPNPNPYKPYGACLVLAVNLKIKYKNGKEEVITSGEDWKTENHRVMMSNVYGSEIIDNRLYKEDWNSLNFDDDNWKNAELVSKEDAPRGKLVLQSQPPIKVIKEYEGKYLHTVGDRQIYDFGLNASALLNIELKGKCGEEVKIYPAEKLDENGNADQMAKNWLPIDSCVTCVLRGDEDFESFETTFTYVACRYIAVEGEAEVGKITAKAITSAWKTDGYFKCDDERYNKIYDMIERTVEANMLSVHTDCPTIERFAWQEPNHLMAPSIFYMKDGKKLWEKFFLDLRTAQHTKDDFFFDVSGERFYPGEGLVPSQAPCYIPNVLPVPGMGSFYDIIPWGSTCILGVWWHYQFYGDKKALSDNYEMGKKYLEHLKTKINENGFINHGLGDWGNPEGLLARENIETAFLYADATVLSKIASILGEKEYSVNFANFAEGVKENYNEKLLCKNPTSGKWCYRVWGDEFKTTQSAEALPLFWGMVPDDKKNDVVSEFKQTLLDKDAFSSGEIGLPYIIQTASKFGMNDLIGKFITREKHPSYYAFVLDGETTLGEYWENNPRSHCHDMMGHIIEWYYNGIAGIKPLEPGFKKISIKPYMPDSMNEFECSYNSASGLIKVSAKRNGDKVDVKVSVPDTIEYNVEA